MPSWLTRDFFIKFVSRISTFSVSDFSKIPIETQNFHIFISFIFIKKNNGWTGNYVGRNTLST
jgi:hypothetical protein